MKSDIKSTVAVERRYEYIVYVQRDGEPVLLKESVKTTKTRAIANTLCEVVERIGICATCPTEGAIPHVLVKIAKNLYAKHCPVLFHDVLKPPSWSPAEVV